MDFVASYRANEDNADTGSTVLAIETHHGKIPQDALFLIAYLYDQYFNSLLHSMWRLDLYCIHHLVNF